MQRRHRFKQTTPLQQRLTEWAKTVLEKANQLPPGPERDDLIKKARQADTAAHLDDWANSSGLQPPK
jgi:hypothetical protein